MTEQLDRSDLNLTFEADFSAPPRLRLGKLQPTPLRPLRAGDPEFSWVSGYVHTLPMTGVNAPADHPYPAWSSLGSRTADSVRGEMEVYPNADAIAVTGATPFQSDHARLNVIADHMPSQWRDTVSPRLPSNYLSGALVSYPFGQLYGVFEMRARLPRGRGLWPAFWLLPHDLSWPPEIDVMEVLGHDPLTLYTTVHTAQVGHHQHFGKAYRSVDLSRGFNDFTVDWGPEQIVFYLNHAVVFAYPTPSDLHKPCYLLLNLAIGAPGSWPGAPDATTPFPASMTVAHVRAWQRRGYVTAP
jgi:beta-glucanase (GH16 family)